MADLNDIAQAAVLRPGDRFVVRLAQGTTSEDVDDLLELLQRALPGVDVVVLGGGVKDMAVYRRPCYSPRSGVGRRARPA